MGKLGKRMTELEAVDDEGISGFRKEFEVSVNSLIVSSNDLLDQTCQLRSSLYFLQALCSRSMLMRLVTNEFVLSN